MAFSEEGQAQKNFCVVRIIQTMSQNVDMDGVSHPSQIWIIKLEGYSEDGDRDSKLKASPSDGGSMWLPERQAELLRMFASKLGDPARKNQEEVDHIIEKVTSSGTIDLAVVRLMSLARWKLLSSHKVAYAPEEFFGTEVNGSIILGPFDNHWVTEFYFENY